MSDEAAVPTPDAGAEGAHTGQRKTEPVYSQLTKGQQAQLKAGKLPGEIKLHAITFFTALIALVISIVALFLAQSNGGGSGDAQSLGAVWDATVSGFGILRL